MLKRALIRIGFAMLFFTSVIISVNTHCYAEGAGDLFLYDVSKLPKDILTDTIGMVRFTTVEIEKGIQQYEREKNSFTPKNFIQLKETYPVGIGGYGGWYKYLVVEVSGEFIKIIFNPYRNSRVWVKPNIKTVDGDSLIIYDDLIGKNLNIDKIGEIDIFILSKEIKLYKEPKESSDHVIVKKNFPERRVFYPVAFKKNFIQIGEESFDDDTIETTYGEPIGWIKMKNNDDAIAFYLYTFSWL